jgi:hypothetical protein
VEADVAFDLLHDLVDVAVDSPALQDCPVGMHDGVVAQALTDVLERRLPTPPRDVRAEVRPRRSRGATAPTAHPP